MKPMKLDLTKLKNCSSTRDAVESDSESIDFDELERMIDESSEQNHKLPGLSPIKEQSNEVALMTPIRRPA